MNEFTISQNEYLKQDINAYYHTSYTRMGNEGNPDYLNELKNTFNNSSSNKLDSAVKELKKVLKKDLPKVLKKLDTNALTVCVIPRAKAQANYKKKQLLFKSTVKSVVNKLDDFNNGIKYIKRHTGTRTTHLSRDISGNKNGKDPYVGITTDTCTISDDVRGKDILLIDDIYTGGVNIDEDAIQALLNNGANSVTFYAIGACRL